MIKVIDINGNIKETSNGGGGVQYTSGSATPTNPIGTMPVFDDNGTIANVSEANGLPVTDKALTDNSQKSQIINAAGDAVTVTGNKLDVNATFSGTVSQDISELGGNPIDTNAGNAGSGTMRVVVATDQATLPVAGIVAVSNFPGTQPVSGTVAVSNFPATQAISAAALPLPAGAAIAANQQTDALTDTQLRASPVSVTFTPGGTQDTNVIELGGTPIDTDAGNSSAGTQRVVLATDQPDVPISAASLPLPAGAAIAANQQTDALTDTQLRAAPVVVSGTVTVDTSLLATAAKQDIGNASLSVLDDWDESDRAKVNPIVGQAGVAAGTGVDGATVQRVSLATNVPLPAGTNLLGITQTKDLPDAGATYALSNATSTANEASHVIKATPGYLFSLNGYNAKGSSQYIQLHDATSVPAETAVPVYMFIVPTASNFSLDYSKFGRYFVNGIVVVNSSTQQTKTIGSSDCWFDAQYI